MLRWLRAEELDAALEAFARRGLSAREQAQLAGLRIAKRRREWLLGRIAAKRLVSRLLAPGDHAPVKLATVELRQDPGGAPYAALAAHAEGLAGVAPGERLPVALSLSHSNGRALCAALASADPRDRIGCDLERIEARSAAFVHDFFDATETAAWRAAGVKERDRLATTIWSAKEAVLKALGLGLSVDTRCVHVTLSSRAGAARRSWSGFEASWAGAGEAPARIRGWWRADGEWVETLVLVVEGSGGH